MNMPIDYDQMVLDQAQRVFDVMRPRVSDEDYSRIVASFDFANAAHRGQKRLSGEPYIMHPIAVALILAVEMNMSANCVIAGFLHDVVEDTSRTISDIRDNFGDDVAFLVDVVTKKKREAVATKQIDNFSQLLSSINYDIRALLVKIADRLHNMRTLNGQKKAYKQVKIAGETDFFYAPLTNRLGLYDIKVELENLSFKYRCPQEYEVIALNLEKDRNRDSEQLQKFMSQIRHLLVVNGIDAEVTVVYRQPYSTWRKMKQYNSDFMHVRNRHYVKIIFKNEGLSNDKELALKIYSVLTDKFQEKLQSMVNYIDSPKENSYSSLHFKLMADNGCWEEVHVASEQMALVNRLGCVALRGQGDIQDWIERLRNVLKEIGSRSLNAEYMDNVVSLLYADDIQVFTNTGISMRLPVHSTVLDFAFEAEGKKALHTYYAKINRQLASIKTELNRGDIVELFFSPQVKPKHDWFNAVNTYKAKSILKEWFDAQPKSDYCLCSKCHPIPGEEVIGIKKSNGVMIHKRDCHVLISEASQYGDQIVDVDFTGNENITFPVAIQILAIDRYRLLNDVIDFITNNMKIFISGIPTSVVDSIVTFKIHFSVRNVLVLRSIMSHISNIDGIDEVKQIPLSNQ